MVYLLVLSDKRRRIVLRRRKRRRRRLLGGRGHILSRAHHPISRAVPHLHHQPIGNRNDNQNRKEMKVHRKRRK